MVNEIAMIDKVDTELIDDNKFRIKVRLLLRGLLVQAERIKDYKSRFPPHRAGEKGNI